MSGFARLIWAILTVAGLGVIIVHHRGYFRKSRPLTFGAFLETAGWIILTLVALTALGGGIADAGRRIVEIVAAIVGVLLIGIGGQFR